MQQSMRNTDSKLLDKLRSDLKEIKTEREEISTSGFLAADLEVSESDSGINMSTESEANLIGQLTGSPLTQSNSANIHSTPVSDTSSHSHIGQNVQLASPRSSTETGSSIQHRTGLFELDAMENLPDVYVSDVDTNRETDSDNRLTTSSRYSARSNPGRVGDVSELNCTQREGRGFTVSRRVRTCSENAAYVTSHAAGHSREDTDRQAGTLQASGGTRNSELLGAEGGLTPRHSEDSWFEGDMRRRALSAPTIIEHVVALELRSISDSFNSLYEGSDIDREVPFIRDRARSSLPLMGARKKNKSLLAMITRYLPSRSQAVTNARVESNEAARALREEHRFCSVPEDEELCE